jgi:hypothetical protein
MHARRTWLAISQTALFVVAVAVAVVVSRPHDWQPWPLVALLLALAVATDLLAIHTRNLRISGSHVAFVLAMVLLGPAPAAAIGVASVLIDAPRSRPSRLLLLNNLVTYASFTLAGGLTIRALAGGAGIGRDEAAYLLLVFAVFLLSNVLNFTMSVGALCVLDGGSLWKRFRTMFVPVIPSELSTALLTVGIVWVYQRVGLAALALLTAVLFTFQYLLRELLTSQDRAEHLEVRGRQLASLQLGLMSSLMHTLDLRDRMTARHCAAVAHYSREIARELDLPKEDQELVHTAGLCTTSASSSSPTTS